MGLIRVARGLIHRIKGSGILHHYCIIVYDFTLYMVLGVGSRMKKRPHVKTAILLLRVRVIVKKMTWEGGAEWIFERTGKVSKF